MKKYSFRIQQVFSVLPLVLASAVSGALFAQTVALKALSSPEHVFSTEYIVIDPADSSAYANYGAAGKDGYENFINLLQVNGYAKKGEPNAIGSGSSPSVYIKAVNEQ